MNAAGAVREAQTFGAIKGGVEIKPPPHASRVMACRVYSCTSMTRLAARCAVLVIISVQAIAVQTAAQNSAPPQELQSGVVIPKVVARRNLNRATRCIFLRTTPAKNVGR